MLEISVSHRHILRVLEKENRWLPFDELYRKVQADCDWVAFALELEQLVEQGHVQYDLPCGADTGYYRISQLD